VLCWCSGETCEIECVVTCRGERQWASYINKGFEPGSLSLVCTSHRYAIRQLIRVAFQVYHGPQLQVLMCTSTTIRAATLMNEGAIIRSTYKSYRSSFAPNPPICSSPCALPSTDRTSIISPTPSQHQSGEVNRGRCDHKPRAYAFMKGHTPSLNPSLFSIPPCTKWYYVLLA